MLRRPPSNKQWWFWYERSELRQRNKTRLDARFRCWIRAEWWLDNPWRVFSYADYGDVDTTAFVSNPAQTLGNDLKSSVGLTTQVFSLGLSYHF